MLVLTRRIGERLYIGDDIKIAILDFDRGNVKLGIIAPDDVIILREELKIKQKEIFK